MGKKAGRRKAKEQAAASAHGEPAAPAPVAPLRGGGLSGRVPEHHRLWYLAAALAILACGFTVAFNCDLWFHLAAGRWILQHHAVPRVDAWSYTAAGRPWIDHEWLSELIFQVWARAFGLDSLIVWQWLLLLAAFLLLFRILRRLSGSYAASFALLVCALVVAMPFFDIRPHLWSLLGMVLVIQLALLRQGSLWWLPPIFALWANLHSGVVFGLALLAVLLAIDAIDPAAAGRRRELRLLGAVGLASLAATLLNPHGVGVLTYPLQLLAAGSASRELIAEWRSPFSPGGGLNSPLYPWAIGALVLAALVLLGTGVARDRRRLAWGALAIAAFTLAMSIESRRFITLFAIAASLVSALAVEALARRRRASRWLARAPGWVAGVGLPAAAILGSVLFLWPHPLSSRAFRYTTMSYLLPIDTLDFVEANRLSGKVFAFFLWGGYVDFRTAGRLQVYIDPRSETVFDPATQRAYNRVQYLGDDWQSLLEGSGAQWVLWARSGSDRGALARQLEASGRWRLVHQDGVSVLLARADQALPQPLAAPPDGPFRDWAAAQDAYAGRDLHAAERLLVRAVDRMPDLAPACEDLVNLEERLGPDATAAAKVPACQALLRLEAPR